MKDSLIEYIELVRKAYYIAKFDKIGLDENDPEYIRLDVVERQSLALGIDLCTIAGIENVFITSGDDVAIITLNGEPVYYGEASRGKLRYEATVALYKLLKDADDPGFETTEIINDVQIDKYEIYVDDEVVASVVMKSVPQLKNKVVQ